MLTFVRYANRIVLLGLDSETKQLTVDFCQEKQLESIIEQLAGEYQHRPKDLYLVLPSQPDKEINEKKSLIGITLIFQNL